MSESEKLPYNIVKTTSQLFAGSTCHGMSARDITDFFCYEMNVHPEDAPIVPGSNRAEVFRRWLLRFPIERQRAIVRRLCQEDLSMYYGLPPESERATLLALVDGVPVQEMTAVIAAAAVSSTSIDDIWRKALDRKGTDPEGAITVARSLLESVCKHILDDAGITYGAGEDLPGLYKLTAQHLNLAPSQHQEDVFKRILGGCTSVVEGLGALRNRLGDAHGKGRGAVRPLSRHASLAVNLAGSMAMFLFETMEARRTVVTTGLT